jgi:DNA polymerase-3 subunit gamma/tau
VMAAEPSVMPELAPEGSKPGRIALMPAPVMAPEVLGGGAAHAAAADRPVAQGQPALTPVAEPAAAPEPAPMPEPVPSAAPVPEPAPAPAPAAVPTPEPAPAPAPAPTPEPTRPCCWLPPAWPASTACLAMRRGPTPRPGSCRSRPT